MSLYSIYLTVSIKYNIITIIIMPRFRSSLKIAINLLYGSGKKEKEKKPIRNKHVSKRLRRRDRCRAPTTTTAFCIILLLPDSVRTRTVVFQYGSLRMYGWYIILLY